MKKIVPFNNTLEFNTDVKEITAISLEHEITKHKDIISGVFYINGEYKITEGVLEKEQFNFELPFDIALSDNYKEESLLIDIDDFRYELIADKKLKINIDLYIDGEIEEPSIEYKVERKDKTISEGEEDFEFFTKEERLDLLKDMLNTDEEKNTMIDVNINNNDNENTNENTKNIFNTTSEEKYVTYRVYKVLENDNLDSILTKYNITKEMLCEYNDIENMKTGDKLIIPTNEK